MNHTPNDPWPGCPNTDNSGMCWSEGPCSTCGDNHRRWIGECVDAEIAAAELAAEILDVERDVKVGDLTGPENSGWMIHQFDSMRGDLEHGEVVGFLARQIVEHDANHEPTVAPDSTQSQLELAELMVGVLVGDERAHIVRDMAASVNQPIGFVLVRAVEEYAVKQGYGRRVEIARRKEQGR